MVWGALCASIGCGGPPRGAKHVGDPDPGVKIPAMQVVVKEKDRAAIPKLVADLASDDPAVRFYAIESLQRLTGQTLDYNYYAPEEDRAAAVARWQAWLKQNQH